jgi:heterodisulfide reductase subunit A
LCLEFQLNPEKLQVRKLSRQPVDAETAESPYLQKRGKEEASQKVIGSVMVVGGGIAGIQASLDLADQGYYVYLVEKSAGIGGKMSQLDKTYPTNDCAM